MSGQPPGSAGGRTGSVSGVNGIMAIPPQSSRVDSGLGGSSGGGGGTQNGAMSQKDLNQIVRT